MTTATKVLRLGLLLTLAACGPADEAPEAMPEAAAPAPAPMATDGFLDPNGASSGELAMVPGLDEATVESLVSGRPYADMVAVNAALPASLTDEQRDEIFSRVWLPLDLNAASEDEIMLIPGVGSQLAHEFEEYRPYDAIERFRREIGKYVDEAEVARLERYVEIR